MNSLQVAADVSESNLDQVKAGQPCEIQLDALPDKRFRGEVHMVIPTADRSKATVMVKVRFVDKDPRVLPEMSAKVAFLSKAVNPPADAIAFDGLARGLKHIEKATREPRDPAARWNMMSASMQGATAFQKGLGAVHSLSHAPGALKLGAERIGPHQGTLNVRIPRRLQSAARGCGFLSGGGRWMAGSPTCSSSKVMPCRCAAFRL